MGHGARALLRPGPYHEAEAARSPGRSQKAELMTLTSLSVDQSEHTRDGLLLRALDGPEPVLAFISRRVMDQWANLTEPAGAHLSLFRAQYNALGLRNLPAIERIVASKYQRGPEFNRQHPFIDVVLADIVESGEVLELGKLAR
jgi:hypothetical protein